MTALHTLLLVFHVLLGAMIIGLVLVQRGKGAETGAAFGSGASATVFGAKGSANFLSRSTAVVATLFFATSLTLTYLGAQRPAVKSVIEQTSEPGGLVPAPGAGQPEPAPGGPAAPASDGTPGGPPPLP